MTDAPPGAARRGPHRAVLPLLILFTVLPASGSPAGPDGTIVPVPALPDSAIAPSSLPRTILNDIGVAFHDALGFYLAPLSFGPEDRTRTAAGLGAVGVVMAMDEPLNSLLISHPDQGFMHEPLEWAQEWGKLRTMQYASVGVYLGGLLAGKNDIRVTGRLMGEALMLAGAPAITLQYGLGRSRPSSGDGAFKYNFFEWSNEFQSLPSGHATVAFAISTVLAKQIDRVWASVPLYAFAGLTALSMTWGNEHWPSDVLIGSALGYLAGSFVVSEDNKRAAGGMGSGGAEDNFNRFDIGFGAGGVSLKYHF